MLHTITNTGTPQRLLGRSLLLLACLSLACARASMDPVSIEPGAAPPAAARRPAEPEAGQSLGTIKGSAGEIPAYYDDQLFTINFAELSPTAEESVIGHNPSFNIIYTSDETLPGGGAFVSVIDAIQQDGFNPLWREVEIEFNAGFTPRQLFSDTDVEAAAAGATPEITLTVTDEIYRCSVVGKK